MHVALRTIRSWSVLSLAAVCLIQSASASTSLHASFAAAQSVVPTGSLDYPYRVAIDSAGNVYISNTEAEEVLKETWSQATQTYTESVVVPASYGLTTPYGIAVDASGNVYVADNGHHRVVKSTPEAGSYTQSVVTTTTTLSFPTGLAVDSSGKLYIADTGNGEILIETPSGSNYTEQALTYSSNFAQITGIAVDSSGDIFVSDIGNMAVYEEAYSAGIYTPSTISTASLNYPYDIAVDSGGNLYIADYGNDRIVEETYVSAGNYTQSVFPTANLVGPLGIAVDATGNIYIADTFGFSIKKETLAGGNFDAVQVGSASSTISMLFAFSGGDISDTLSLASISTLTQGATGLDFASTGSGAGFCSTTATYNPGDSCFVNVVLTPQYPGQRYGAVTLSGTVTTLPEIVRQHNAHPENASRALLATGYLTGLGIGPQVNFQIQPFSLSSVSVIASPSSPYSLKTPYDTALDASGNVYIVDYNNNAVYKETLSAGSYTQSTVASGLSHPQAVAVDGAGNVYIADSGNGQILMESWQNGSWVQTMIAADLDTPAGVAVDATGNVYFSSYEDYDVYVLTLSSGSYSLPVAVVTGLKQPRKIAIDGSGDIFIADTGNNRVVEEIPNGAGYSQTVVDSALQQPYGVAVGAGGLVYVADTGGDAILLETPSGSSFTQSVLISGPVPYGIALDERGNVYFPDVNQSVYKIDFADAPSLAFASTDIGLTSSDSPQTVEILNVGNAALTLPASGSGSNPAVPAGFELGTATTCPEVPASGSAGSLAVDASCVYAVDFVPAAALSYSVTLALTDNNLNQSAVTQNVGLSGTGVSVLGSFTLTGAPPTSVAGTSFALTLTARNPQGATDTSYLGTVHLSSSDAQAVFSLTSGGAPIASYAFQSADAGVKVLYVTFKTVGGQTATATDTSAAVTANSSSDLVTAGAATTLSAPYATEFTTTIGALLGVLDVSVSDAYGNPVSGVTVTYAVPSSGPSAVLSATSAQTSGGITSVAAYANGIAGGPYTVTASVPDLVGSPVSFTGTNLTDTTATTLATSPGATSVYGTSVTLTATVTPAYPRAPDVVRARAKVAGRTASGGKPAPADVFNGPPAIGPPTGTVSFYDTVGSSTRLLGTSTIGGASGNSPELHSYPGSNPGPNSSPNARQNSSPAAKGTPPVAGTATFAITAPVGGGHSYTSVYGADANFTASTSSAAPYTVTLAPVTVAGPASQPVQVPINQAGSIPVTVSGSKSGASIAEPTGSVSYTILTATGAAAGSGTASLTAGATDSTASIPTPSTLATGAYTIQVNYLGDGNYAVTTAPVAIAIEVGKVATAIVWPQPAAIVYGTSLSAVLDATAKAGSTTVAGTFAYSVASAGGVGSSVTAATVLAAGSYTLAVTFTPTDAATYTTATGSVTLTVGTANASIALVSSSNPQYVQDAIVFTATVASLAGVPTGTVAFYDGSTLLGSVTLASGVAAYTTSSLALGTHSITAVYSGDANFSAVTSTAVAEVVQDFNLTISTTSGGSSTATASPGGTAVYPLVFTPVDGTTFPLVVKLTVSGLPAGATATLTPDTLPAGSGSTPVTLAVVLSSASASSHGFMPFRPNRLPLALGLILLPFAGRFRRTIRRLRAGGRGSRWTMLLLLAALGLAATAGLAGCGGKSTGYFGQTPKTYILTITGTSGALSHSTTVTLTIE